MHRPSFEREGIEGRIFAEPASEIRLFLGIRDMRCFQRHELRALACDQGAHLDIEAVAGFEAAAFQSRDDRLIRGRLTEVFRQAAESRIVVNAHRMLLLTRSLWAFGKPQKSIRLITICFSLQILFAGGADGYNNSNRSAMSLNKKRPLAALYFANRITQRDFPLRAFVAANVGNPFMGAHSFSSVNALYLYGVRHPNLLKGACYQDRHAFVRTAMRL
jgi:hypothetical protein